MADSWSSVQIVTLSWWDDGMTGVFSTSDSIETGKIQTAYDHLMERFRAGLCVTHQARPLLATPS